MQLIVVTGLSGSGKTIALNELEDLGYYCIDNLPGVFLLPITKHLHDVGRERLAVALDSRGDVSLNDLASQIKALGEKGVDVRVLYLTASTPVLVQRFSETRRQHPLSRKEGNTLETLTDAIEKERAFLDPIVTYSHLIDTSGMLPGTLRKWVDDFVNVKEGELILTFESFGFKRGLPMASDLVFDVRCLPNPYWEESLRPFTGKDQPVIDFLAKSKEVSEMIGDISHFIEKWLPFYLAQNRHYLTVSIGCTGGQHRSVYIVEALSKYFSKKYDSVITRHRALDNVKK